MARVLGEEALGLDARLDAARPSRARGERLGARAAPPARTAAPRGASPSSWNSCSKLATQPRAELAARARRAPRAGSAAGSTPTGARRSRRCRTAAARARVSPARRSTRTLRGGVGQQPQVARRAERVGLRERPERRERVVGGHPADAAVRGARRAREASTERPRTIAPRSQHDERDQLGRAHAALARVTVPLSHMPSRSPSAGRARAHAPRRPRRRRPRCIPPAGMSRRSSAAASRSAGCRCTPPVAERRVGVGDRVQASRAGRSTRPTTHTKWPTSQSGAGPSCVAVEQVGEQLGDARRARPTGGGSRGWRSASPGRSQPAQQRRTARRARPRVHGPRVAGSPSSVAAGELDRSPRRTPGGGRPRDVRVVDRRDLQAVVAPARFAVRGAMSGSRARRETTLPRGERHGVLVERLAAARARSMPAARSSASAAAERAAQVVALGQLARVARASSVAGAREQGQLSVPSELA